MKRLFITFALIAFAAAPALAGPPVNETHAATPDASVNIDNIAGQVTIVGWDKNSVQITGNLGSDDQELQVSGDNDDIDIHVEYPEHRNILEGAMLVIKLPKGAAVEASTVSADIDARQVVGSQRLKSVSGEITLESKSPEISAESVSGDVKVTGSAPDAHVEASGVSSDVHVASVNGELRGKSVSGNVYVENSQLKRAEMGSTSGNISYSAAFENGGVYEFHSTSGDIRMTLPGKPDAEFDIETFSGDIDNAFGPKAERTSRYAPGSELHFSSGNGSADVRAETLSGDVELRIGG
ncbi:MAG TPA: DUF4097 family beta strand repeat-containing protein [Gammaproteobacteria bacterium]|nr:DUF4097 family beta strand repeat-containing protein [Gammaproteobacteria bacterium]